MVSSSSARPSTTSSSPAAAATAGRRSTSRRPSRYDPAAASACCSRSRSAPASARGADRARELVVAGRPVRRQSPRRCTGSTRQKHYKAGPLVFHRRRRVLGRRGDEHAEPADPRDKSFQHDIGGREIRSTTRARTCTWSCCATATSSYWVVNTLLDALSNETMIAIAKGLKPLRSRQVESRADG